MKKSFILFTIIFFHSIITYSMEPIESAEVTIRNENSLEESLAAGPLVIQGVQIPLGILEGHRSYPCSLITYVKNQNSHSLGIGKIDSHTLDITELQKFTIEWYKTTNDFSNIVMQKCREINKNMNIMSFLGGLAFGGTATGLGAWLWFRNKK